MCHVEDVMTSDPLLQLPFCAVPFKSASFCPMKQNIIEAVCFSFTHTHTLSLPLNHRLLHCSINLILQFSFRRNIMDQDTVELSTTESRFRSADISNVVNPSLPTTAPSAEPSRYPLRFGYRTHEGGQMDGARVLIACSTARGRTEFRG
jgi:hypothetical protein